MYKDNLSTEFEISNLIDQYSMVKTCYHYAIYLHIHFSFFTFSLSQENHAVLHDQFRFCFYEIICS